MIHQAADEVNVAAEPVQLGDDDRRLVPLGELESGCQLRALIWRVGALARLNLSESLNQLVILGLGEPGERRLLRFQLTRQGWLCNKAPGPGPIRRPALMIWLVSAEGSIPGSTDHHGLMHPSMCRDWKKSK